MLRLPWEVSSSQQELIDQRNSGNTNDLSILSRQSGVLTHGSLSEAQNFFGRDVITYHVEGSGAGHAFVTPAGPIVTMAPDGPRSVIYGDTFPTLFDSVTVPAPYHANTTSTSANQTIATIPLSPGTQTYALSQIFVRIQGLNESTGDWAAFTHEWSYRISGGVITAPTGSQPAAVDKGHSAGAGTSIAPQFAISGGNIQVQVTPWASSGIHWTVDFTISLNAGQPPLPTAPPGSPVFWWRADIQGLGVATQLLDQSGGGNNLSIITGSARTITSNSGPGGTLPSLQFNAAGVYAIANALGLGTKNFTLAVVGQVASTSSGQQAFCSFGNVIGGDGIALGVDLQLTGARDAIQAGVGFIEDGAATTNWEAWVFSSDASGNLSLLVNGASQSLSPSNQTGVAPSADFTVGGNASGTYQLAGALFEVIAYNTIESASAIYAYQHAITNL
jgi:hypothetical protein